MSTDQPTEQELQAAYEAEIKKIRVEQILLEQIVSLVNLGMRRTGLAPGTEDERDVGQVRLAIDAVRALLPLAEPAAGPQAGAIRDALSQLQLAFVRLGGSPESVSQAGGPGAERPPASTAERPPASPAGPGDQGESGPGPAGPTPPRPSDPEGKPGEGGPAQRSGRLWVPGQ